MNEIEQLRADIATMEASMLIATRLNADASYHNLKGLKRELQDQIAKLESEAAEKADPWAVEKSLVKGYLTDLHASTYGQMVAKYAQHLEQRVADLEVELARTKEAHETVGEAYDCKREDNKDLRRTVKELQAELARRPVVWCVRHKGNILKQSASPSGGVWDCYHFTGLFPTRLDAAKLMRGGPEPYTGEQS